MSSTEKDDKARPFEQEDPSEEPLDGSSVKVQTKDLSLWYGSKQALFKVSLKVPKNKVTAFIGPSGCGKSTLIRCFNRMNDFVNGCRTEGKILIDGKDINEKGMNLVDLRRNVGMVFQKPNPFPFSLYENVAIGLRQAGIRDRRILDTAVEKALMEAAIYDEVSDRMDEIATDLSGGQQQRLCIARALAMQPEIILMDEPCSALDPIATSKIEELMRQLKKDYTVVIVTHNMEQALRVSEYTGFMHMGNLIEFGRTKELFEDPKEKKTQDYLKGKFS